MHGLLVELALVDGVVVYQFLCSCGGSSLAEGSLVCEKFCDFAEHGLVEVGVECFALVDGVFAAPGEDVVVGAVE